MGNFWILVQFFFQFGKGVFLFLKQNIYCGYLNKEKSSIEMGFC